jgi:hypothetical protein
MERVGLGYDHFHEVTLADLQTPKLTYRFPILKDANPIRRPPQDILRLDFTLSLYASLISVPWVFTMR